MKTSGTVQFTEHIADEIRAVRHEARLDAGCGGQCGDVAEWICRRYGWANIGGVYLSPSLEPIGDHVWNELPDGSILDATADQFCEGHDVRLVPPGSPEHRRYRLEWTADFNPDLAEHYPDLAGTQWSGEFDLDWSRRLRAERGDGWWLSNPSQYREWNAETGYEAPPRAPSVI
jgi:hypothetical protein